MSRIKILRIYFLGNVFPMHFSFCSIFPHSNFWVICSLCPKAESYPQDRDLLSTWIMRWQPSSRRSLFLVPNQLHPSLSLELTCMWKTSWFILMLFATYTCLLSLTFLVTIFVLLSQSCLTCRIIYSLHFHLSLLYKSPCFAEVDCRCFL